MGGLPPAGSWYRLEVPASYIGLEGKAVSGMAFNVYGIEPTIAWDRSGKAPQPSSVPLPLSAATGALRLFNNTFGYAFETNDLGAINHPPQKKDVFFVYPNQAAGTVPMYRFRRPANYEYFYSRCKECYSGNGWDYYGVAFYVYADGSTPGTVPLYLYHDSIFHYFLTTDQAEVSNLGMTFDAIWAYVYANDSSVPLSPQLSLVGGTCGYLYWYNGYTSNLTGYKIERMFPWEGVWTQIATVAADVTSYNASCSAGSATTSQSSAIADPESRTSGDPSTTPHFRIRATNVNGDSNYSNEVYQKCFPGAGHVCTMAADPPNQPPDVTITSPSDGDLVDQNFAIIANAFDVDGAGTIAKVEFFANGSKLGEVTTAPYVFPWSNVASGTYSLTTIATDAAGATTTSSPVSVTVDLPPVLSITSPMSGTVFNAPATVSINASASDSDGTISKVEFFNGSTKLGEVTTAPYVLNWTNVPAGNYVLTAIATDNLGRPTTSNSVNVVVNSPPSASIASPPTGTVITAPANITINANASDSDGTISKVEFYQGATLLGTNTTSPYSFVWNNVPAGSYFITAKAADNLGAVTTSSPVSIIVNAPPTVSITSPVGGTSFTAPASINISAVASDSDGTVSKVEFFQGATLIGTATTSPYTFNWSNLPVANYSFSAKATDNLGAVTTSTSVNITVVQASTSNKIAFASNRDGSAQIYAMNSDGSGVVRLTNDIANDESPKWSPNNSRIVFQSDRDNLFSGIADIYVMNWDGSGQTRLTNDPADDSAPVWSPDGTKIAFQSARNGVNYQVYVMNADGSGQVNISNSTANDRQPSWSPDGTKIAFASDRDQPGFSSIYVMNANGTNQTRLTTSGAGVLDQQPVWSPDGTKLTFTSTRDSITVTWQETDDNGGIVTKSKLLVNKEVYVMNANGSAQVRLTNTLENDDSASWSGDGTKIVFRSDRGRDCCDPLEQVWLMNADGSNQIDLSNNAFGDYCPSWSH